MPRQRHVRGRRHPNRTSPDQQRRSHNTAHPAACSCSPISAARAARAHCSGTPPPPAPPVSSSAHHPASTA